MKEPKYWKEFNDYDNDMPEETSLEDVKECHKYREYLKNNIKVVKLNPE